MAKKDNLAKLTGGLTAGLDFGDSKKVENEAPVQQEAPVQETAAPQPAAPEAVAPEAVASAGEGSAAPAPMSLADVYKGKMQAKAEARSARLQVVVTPTTAAKLDELVKEHRINSKNDLINVLLEEYLRTLD